MRWIRNLSELTNTDLPLAGGKAANLGVLIRGGMPVPPGFCILTDSYGEFVRRNELQQEIGSTLATIGRAEPGPLEAAAEKIRALFIRCRMPPEIAEEIRAAYRALDPAADTAVAVRSSATAEDLPEMSFAGQQETFLNIIGADPLLEKVVECWASLWTARAIGYRMRNAVPAEGLALAVAVQRMIPSEVSGVLFTANPLSGSRRETVIDATFGLGEALVAGKVEPDHYVVRMPEERILSTTLGGKAFQIRGREGGGTEGIQGNWKSRQALSDEQILELARLGARACALFPDPQDIEWALADGKFHIVQSRPITSLFPVPEGLADGKLKVFFSFAAVQGMQDPMTPLGRDSLKMIVSAAAKLFGVRNTAADQTVFYAAGERIWMNFTPILSNSIGRRIVPYVTAMVEPTIGQALEQIKDESDLAPGRAGISLGAFFRLARFLFPLGSNILRNMISPRTRREAIVADGERLLAEMETQCAAIRGDRFQRLDKVIRLLPDLAEGNLPHTFLRFVSGVAAGMSSWNALNMIAGKAIEDPAERAQAQDLILQVTRGMPYNPTTEMDLALWEMAKAIRRDPPSRAAVQGGQAGELARSYRAGELPAPVLRAVERFLGIYGGRGFGEIDLGRTRWAEDPTHVFEMLINFLQIEDEDKAPDAVFTRSAASAEESVGRLAAMVGNSRGGWIKARLVRFFAGRARQLMGAR
ncbi:MAG: hypothetical protein JW748_05045, partial [Anaerolineales bacterium]|nr:hypothetical protein [Anaerolineales bacterium]